MKDGRLMFHLFITTFLYHCGDPTALLLAQIRVSLAPGKMQP
jgi:hypothetical protein